MSSNLLEYVVVDEVDIDEKDADEQGKNHQTPTSLARGDEQKEMKMENKNKKYINIRTREK